jgi:Tol biopolymer transport system component
VTFTASGAVWMLVSPDRDRPVPFRSPVIEQLTFGGTAHLAAISPDGRYVVHAESNRATSSLHVRQVGTASHVEIVPPAEGEYDGLTFSPDGEYIYYVWYPRDGSTGFVYRTPALGGTPRLVLEDSDTPLAFAPDGRRFAFIRTTGADTRIVVATLGERGERVLATRTSPQQFLVIDIGWSPDGRYIAAAERDRRDARVRLVAIDAATGHEQPVSHAEWYGFSGLVWRPDGAGLLVTGADAFTGAMGNQVFDVPWPPGERRRVTSDLASYSTPRLTADGRGLVVAREDRATRLWTVRLTDAGSSAPMGVLGDGGGGLDLAADGTLVYTSLGSGRSDLWLIEPGHPPRALTFDAVFELEPRFTPDGQHVVYYAVGGVTPALRAIHRDGTGQTTISVTMPRSLNAPTGAWFTPDGQWVLFTDAARGIERQSMEAQRAERVTIPALDGLGIPIALLALSPDGRLMAVSYADSERRNRIAIVSADGRVVVQRLDLPGGEPGVGGRPLQFSADGSRLYFASTQDGVGNIVSTPIAGGPPLQITRFESDAIFRFAVSRDERTAIVSRGPVRADIVAFHDRPDSTR